MIKMMDLMNKLNYAKNVKVDEYVRIHYDKRGKPSFEGQGYHGTFIKKFHMNFSMNRKNGNHFFFKSQQSSSLIGFIIVTKNVHQRRKIDLSASLFII